MTSFKKPTFDLFNPWTRPSKYVLLTKLNIACIQWSYENWYYQVDKPLRPANRSYKGQGNCCLLTLCMPSKIVLCGAHLSPAYFPLTVSIRIFLASIRILQLEQLHNYCCNMHALMKQVTITYSWRRRRLCCVMEHGDKKNCEMPTHSCARGPLFAIWS